jgi:hypothetical protein
MPATDTAPPPDTTPPSPAAATKATGGKKGGAPAEQDAPAAETATDAVPDAADAAPEPEPPAPGWFRNTATTELIVMPDRYPSKQLAPGEATWLPDDPRHPNLERCDAPAPAVDAADTTGSEK